jgi:PDDEXK-like domain of unknown function (DUF3799)
MTTILDAPIPADLPVQQLEAYATPREITEPGVYDMTAEIYHRDPVPGGSLSSSGARKLLPPSCPAKFKWERDHPQAHKKEFDIGHAVHKLVLGDGPEVIVVDAGDWKTAKARDERDEAYALGQVPLLEHQYLEVLAMVRSLRQHPVADALFAHERGRPEQSLFWVDKQTGVWRRARLDWLPDPDTGRMIAGDLKTGHDASPEGIEKAVRQHGYHQQGAWYLDGIEALDLAPDPAFVFVFVEKSPPYLVTVAEVDAMALRIARDLNRQALELFRDCTESGVWPGYSDKVIPVRLPAWMENEYLREMS